MLAEGFQKLQLEEVSTFCKTTHKLNSRQETVPLDSLHCSVSTPRLSLVWFCWCELLRQQHSPAEASHSSRLVTFPPSSCSPTRCASNSSCCFHLGVWRLHSLGHPCFPPVVSNVASGSTSHGNQPVGEAPSQRRCKTFGLCHVWHTLR